MSEIRGKIESDLQIAIKVGGRVFVMDAADILEAVIEQFELPYNPHELSSMRAKSAEKDYLITVRLHGRNLTVHRADDTQPDEMRVIDSKNLLGDGKHV